MIRFFFGDIISVEGEFQRAGGDSGFEERAVAWLRTEEGIDVFLEAGGKRDYFVFELEIWGTDGKIVIGNGYERLYLKKKSRLYRGFKDLGEVKFPAFKRNNCFRELYREAGKIMEGGSARPVSDIMDGYRALEAIHAVYLSSHRKRKKIDLPLDPKSVNIRKIFNFRQVRDPK